ncbi:hypothetical protein E8E14_009058 [Neopestalotiopsis sp. 37M]|nr:hypothetical protein E8E14_009058 [Neopestalotiopsis sp. 37M]
MNTQHLSVVETILFSQPYVQLSLAAVFLLFLRYALSQSDNIPFINPKKSSELTASRPRSAFLAQSKEILSKGHELYPDQPYRANTDWGEVLLLPPSLINELRSDPRLDFLEVAQDDSHAYVPGFEPFRSDPKITAVVMKYLTKALTKITKNLSDEATLALQESFTDSQEWHEIHMATAFLNLISRLSSRVFMGETLCRNKEWVEVSARYTTQAFTTSDVLREWSRPFRPFVHWFIPACKETRRLLAEARRVLEPCIKEREEKSREALARGEPIVYDDALAWFEKEFTKGYDPAIAQISLSLVAIHTTSDLLQVTVLNIARHPELFQALREEIIDVLKTHGLTKQALQNLKLLDSTIKESQRLKPVLLVTWRRAALKEIRLSNGITIRKGQRIGVSNAHMWDSAYYQDPEKFDAYRFLRMRENPAEQSSAHLVSTSEKHLGFGHGSHACPGRFFAANEIKIALCHLLLKYDWKLPDNHEPKPMAYGMSLIPDPRAKLLIRRRTEEIHLESLRHKAD